MKKDRLSCLLRSLRNQPMRLGRYAEELEANSAFDFMDRTLAEVHYEVCLLRDRNARLRDVRYLFAHTDRTLGV